MENLKTKSEPIIDKQELINEQPGHRFQSAERMINFINVNYGTVFERSESCRQYLLNCNYEDFSDLLVQMNAISRGIDPTGHDFDGQEAALLTSELPKWENRQTLLRQALKATKEILAQEPSISPERRGDLAILWGGTLTATHPFLNGNGRMSRVLGLLIDQGFDGTPQSAYQLRATMSKQGKNFFANSPLTFSTPSILLWRFLNDGYQHQFKSQNESDITTSLYSEDTATAVVSLFIETIVNSENYVIDVRDLDDTDIVCWGCDDVQSLSMNDLYRRIFKNLSYLYSPLTPLQKSAAKSDRDLATLLETRRKHFENAVKEGKTANLSKECAVEYIPIRMDIVS